MVGREQGSAAGNRHSLRRRRRRRWRETRDASPWFVSLNGQWRFNWSENPASNGRSDFYRPDFDVSVWDHIPVPSNWQLHGYGYSDLHQYPLPLGDPDPPRVPHDFNPVGSYRRTFTVPEDWNGRQVFVHFGGVSSAFYLWVNGRRGRLQPGQPHAGRVQHHGVPGAGREHARGRGLPLVATARYLEGPGFLAAQRHLPRRLSCSRGATSTSATSRSTPTSTRTIETQISGSTYGSGTSVRTRRAVHDRGAALRRRRPAGRR